MSEVVLAVIFNLSMCDGLKHRELCRGEILDLEKSCGTVECVDSGSERIVKFWEEVNRGK